MTLSLFTRPCRRLLISSTLLFLDKPRWRACLIWAILVPQVRASQHLATLLITSDASQQRLYMPHSRAGLKLAALNTLPPKTSISEVLPTCATFVTAPQYCQYSPSTPSLFYISPPPVFASQKCPLGSSRLSRLPHRFLAAQGKHE